MWWWGLGGRVWWWVLVRSRWSGVVLGVGGVSVVGCGGGCCWCLGRRCGAGCWWGFGGGEWW